VSGDALGERGTGSSRPSARVIRLLSWNVRQGGGRRIPGQVAAIANARPDVVALQEVVAGTVSEYRARVRVQGLEYCVDSFSLAGDREVLIGARRYGLLILSRWPAKPLDDIPVPIPWTERLLSTLVSTPFGVCEVHTAHIPPGASHGWLKIETFEGIYQRLARPCADARILCGDFNSPKDELETGQVITFGQVVRSDGTVRPIKHRDAKYRGRWDAGERSIIADLAAHGFIDAYRALHGYAKPAFSWQLNRRSGPVRRRFDHVFVSDLDPITCEYLHEARKAGLSDHAPVLARLGFSIARSDQPPGPPVLA
jgi:endonuclease/exonuclease/phosphatase family metal-dependent hydrolase